METLSNDARVEGRQCDERQSGRGEQLVRQQSVGVALGAALGAEKGGRTFAQSPQSRGRAIAAGFARLPSEGYSGAELAEIMRNNGLIIAAGTLNKYISEARGRSGKRKKKAKKAAPAGTLSKAITVESGSRTVDAARVGAMPPSLLATKPLAQSRRGAKDVLGHRFDDDV